MSETRRPNETHFLLLWPRGKKYHSDLEQMFSKQNVSFSAFTIDIPDQVSFFSLFYGLNRKLSANKRTQCGAGAAILYVLSDVPADYAWRPTVSKPEFANRIVFDIKFSIRILSRKNIIHGSNTPGEVARDIELLRPFVQDPEQTFEALFPTAQPQGDDTQSIIERLSALEMVVPVTDGETVTVFYNASSVRQGPNQDFEDLLRQFGRVTDQTSDHVRFIKVNRSSFLRIQNYARRHGNTYANMRIADGEILIGSGACIEFFSSSSGQWAITQERAIAFSKTLSRRIFSRGRRTLQYFEEYYRKSTPKTAQYQNLVSEKLGGATVTARKTMSWRWGAMYFDAVRGNDHLFVKFGNRYADIAHEAKISSKLGKAGIGPKVRYVFLGDTSFIAFDHLEFDSNWVQTLAASEPAEKLRFFEMAISVLKKLKEQGVLHRDIRPDNLRVSRSGSEMEVDLLDFGAALDMAAISEIPDHSAPTRVLKNLGGEYRFHDGIWDDAWSMFRVFLEIDPKLLINFPEVYTKLATQLGTEPVSMQGNLELE